MNESEAGCGEMAAFEGLAAFAITHGLCAGDIELATCRNEGTVGVAVRCPGCGATLDESFDLDAIRAHVLRLARQGGFSGPLAELSEAEYTRILLLPSTIDAFIALAKRLQERECQQ
jgi:hypothetical protein